MQIFCDKRKGLQNRGLVRDTNMAELTSCESLEGEAGDVMGVGLTVNALLDWINRIIVNKVQRL